MLDSLIDSLIDLLIYLLIGGLGLLCLIARSMQGGGGFIIHVDIDVVNYCV